MSNWFKYNKNSSYSQTSTNIMMPIITLDVTENGKYQYTIDFHTKWEFECWKREQGMENEVDKFYNSLIPNT